MVLFELPRQFLHDDHVAIVDGRDGQLGLGMGHGRAGQNRRYDSAGETQSCHVSIPLESTDCH